MLDTHTNTDMARLVLAVGSRAGREAPLQYGYYMIGRHSECQIRPKSRSVSRRHCLLFQDDTGLQVLDLNSTAGTRVNDLRIRPKTWIALRNGDMLRCGKVVFRVDLGPPASGERPVIPFVGIPVLGARVTARTRCLWARRGMTSISPASWRRRTTRIENVAMTTFAPPTRMTWKRPTLFPTIFNNTIEMDAELDLFDDAFNDPQPSESAVTGGTDQDPRQDGMDPSRKSGAPSAESKKLSRKEKKRRR